MSSWQSIDTAPKDRYIQITDGICIQDTVCWRDKRIGYYEYNYHHPQPAGWFSINGSRSRLDGKATLWAELLPLPSDRFNKIDI
jgi:hypothetical protein